MVPCAVLKLERELHDEMLGTLQVLVEQRHLSGSKHPLFEDFDAVKSGNQRGYPFPKVKTRWDMRGTKRTDFDAGFLVAARIPDRSATHEGPRGRIYSRQGFLDLYVKSRRSDATDSLCGADRRQQKEKKQQKETTDDIGRRVFSET